jgi:predicted CoA-binding protein
MEPSWDDIRKILKGSKNIAVVGLSNNPDRPSHDIAGYLKRAGYHIIPVNPTIKEALGEKAYASLRDVPDKVDIVQIFRRPEEVPAVVEDAIAIGAKVVWMQPGAENDKAAERAEQAGLVAVNGACMMVAHRTLRL